MSIVTCNINVNVRFSFIINYVSEHRLSHVMDTSHSTPTTHINKGPMLLKLIGARTWCLPVTPAELRRREAGVGRGRSHGCITVDVGEKEKDLGLICHRIIKF